MKVDINKFSFAQMTSNSDGKTSGSGTLGLTVGAAGVIGFIAGVVSYFIFKDAVVMNTSIIVISIGAGLLGYRKSKENSIQADAKEVVGEIKDEIKDEILNEAK